MDNKILLTADVRNFDESVALAREYDLGIEVMAFAYPHVLDGEWLSYFNHYRTVLRPFEGNITCHGPFMDMSSGSPDAKINRICTERYQHAIRIASELGAKRVIFHPNFIGSLHNRAYRDGWHARNVDFWGNMAFFGQKYGVKIALENMWEYDPTIISNILEQVNHDYLRACLDVGHAHVFSDKQFSFDYWLRILDTWIVELHTNNNNGILDEHHGYNWENGVLDYHTLLPQLYQLSNTPDIILEMYEVEDMRDSLQYFEFETESP